MKLTIRKLDIQTEYGLCDSYISYPQSTKSLPGVILFMDAFGPRPSLYEMADTIAKKGYYVLLPNLFYQKMKAPFFDSKPKLRTEDLAKIREIIMPPAKSYDMEIGLKDGESFINFLLQQKEVSGKIGLTGYCMGGRVAFAMAARYPNSIGAIAGFHAGGLATDAPDSPHLLASKIKCEVYFGHADQDTSLPQEQIKKFNQALQNAHVKFETEVYLGAQHGYTQKDLPAFNETAFNKHWDKLFPLFERNLKNKN
jgi:carboxymethylenebutenolidase